MKIKPFQGQKKAKLRSGAIATIWFPKEEEKYDAFPVMGIIETNTDKTLEMWRTDGTWAEESKDDAWKGIPEHPLDIVELV